jgi:PAS domain S-box-containing protein
VRRQQPAPPRRRPRKLRCTSAVCLVVAWQLLVPPRTFAQSTVDLSAVCPGRCAIGAAAVLGAETALLVGLLFQRARRRRAEVAWRNSEARYRNVVDTQTELICRCLPDTTLTFVNDACCRFWVKHRDDLIGTKFLDLIPEERRDDVQLRIDALAEHATLHHEHEVLLPGGGIGWQQWRHHRLVDQSGRMVEVQGVGRDITEQKRAEQELRAAGDALRESYERVEDLAGRLIAAQEAERKRIARDLHDDLSQKRALLAIEIEQLPGHPPNQLSDRVHFISERAGEIATDVHHLAYQLHPAKLESLGLVPAIQGFCRDMSTQHALNVDFEHCHVPPTVAPDIALCLYRIVQEALHNVVRHSGTREASVQLIASSGAIELHVADPGRGFAPELEHYAGIGLVSMRERVNFIGGMVAIHSSPGAGTRIGVRVPLEAVRAQPSRLPAPRQTSRTG